MSDQERLSRTEQQQIRKVAGILGVIQSLAWIILSLTCIILYIDGPDSLSVNSYMGRIRFLIYHLFLARGEEPFPKQALKPAIFFGFMWAYMFMDVAWLICSLLFLTTKRDPDQMPNDAKVWANVTYLICLLDLVTVVILGADYNNCLGMFTYPNILVQQSCANGILPVLVIAAKGFVLWIVNLVFAWVMYKMYLQMKKEQIQQELMDIPPSHRQPRLSQVFSPQSPYPSAPPTYDSVVAEQGPNVAAPPYFPPQRQMTDVPKDQ